jgi:hypothetical protein
MNQRVGQGGKKIGTHGETIQIGSSRCLLVLLCPYLWFELIGATLLLTGCERNETVSTPPATQRASVALKVLVVNDAKLAEAINRLRGEWAERSGGTLAAEARPWADVAKTEHIDADLILFPAQYLGELMGKKSLRPMRGGVLKASIYNASDVLPLARDKLGVYGGTPIAMPLSVVLPMVAVSRDSQEAERIVATWPARESVEHWAAKMLLARAAAYAAHPRQEAVLFDPQTMAARIAEPPFVRALEEWQKEERERNSAGKDAVNTSNKPAAWAELSGSKLVFNRSTSAWETLEGGERKVPFLAGGELLAVTATTRNAASAFDLAAWLASADVARQLGPIGNGALPVRASLLNTSARWVDAPEGLSDSSDIARIVRQALTREEALITPRIPGADEYLAVLSAAVDKALADQASAADALGDVARQWDEITERHGRDVQRRAYLKDLNVEEL